MSTLSRDFSPSALVNDIKVNRFEWYGYLGRSPSAEFHDGPNLTWLLTGVPFPLLNTVTRTEATRDDADEAIEDTVAHFTSSGVTRFTWWVERGARPTDLSDRLLAHGFQYVEGPPGMAADLLALPEDVTAPPDLRIERVEDPAMLRHWVSTLFRGFELPGPGEDALFDVLVGLEFDLPLRHYLGFLDDEPVATSELFLGAGVAGIYGVVTVPKARRRGIGGALTLAPLREARDLGYHIGILHSSEMALGLYRRIGFRKYCRMSHYVWQGGAG